MSIVSPEIAIDWHPTKNGELTPKDITAANSKVVWWKCHICGYEWKTSVNNRTSGDGTGCSVCSGKVVSDKNRFSILYPELLNEWDFDKNKNVDVNSVSYGTQKKVWWICLKCGNSFFMGIGTRTHMNCGCPDCGYKLIESKMATEIKEYCKANHDSISEYKMLKNPKTDHWLKCDVYIPKFNLFIEIHGDQHYRYTKFYHDGKKTFDELQWRDEFKKKFAMENGLYLEIPIGKMRKSSVGIKIIEDFILNIQKLNIE